ncbi:hypothetical protein [Pseudoflavonifractor capillosus]|uniref:hypothetical protein n=1 Tax=Pseudoflavonifractor capillosus TaxID=106588 RepID=UPI00195E8AB6|nr:hypothetical protein [Pseudoflavonifractor capillosus]
MMDPDLIIDDEYVYAVGNDCNQRGKKLEDILDEYVVILKEIKSEAIMAGNVSEALEAFIGCVEPLKDQITELSQRVEERSSNFIQDVNDADQYLF